MYIIVVLRGMYPGSKVHGANMEPTWGQQDPGGPQVGHMNIAIWVLFFPHKNKNKSIFPYDLCGNVSKYDILCRAAFGGAMIFAMKWPLWIRPYESSIEWDSE